MVAAFEDIEVDTTLYLPDMFTIKILDYDLKWINDALFDLGKEVEITVESGSELGGHKALLIKGEITALEADFSIGGDTTFLVRGYDKSHRLHRGKKTRTFLNQKDDAIVRTIAGEVGLTPEIDSTTVTYDYVLQNNQTNMEFLQTRAARLGYQVYAAEGKLYFKKGDAKLGDGPTLKLGEDLDSFRPSLAATHQVDKIEIKGWDPKGKTAITAQATPNGSLNQGGMTQTGGDAAASAFGSATEVIVDQPVFTTTEATALATALSNDLNREFVQAEGRCLGNPGVKPGWTITFDNLGDRFNGKYFVTSATHTYNKGLYETRFTISGRQPNTISHLLESSNGHSADKGLVQGVAVGLVTNATDPDNLGRVKVKYPWLGDDIESDWIRVASPGAGAERGLSFIPEIDDEVLLAFDHGHVHHPYIIGGLWNTQDKPPKPSSEVVSGGVVNERIIKSRTGHLIILDDTDGAEKIIIKDKTENNLITIDSTSGDIEIKATGKLTLESDGDLSMKSATGKATVESQGDMSIESKTGKATVKAMAKATVEGTGGLTLDGKAAISELKGMTTKVNGSAMVQVQGALVKLN
jgi:phage protein D